jgi:hypothetical protein
MSVTRDGRTHRRCSVQNQEPPLCAGRDKGAKPLQAAQPRLRAKRAPKKNWAFWGAWGARRCGYATETAS